MVSAHVTGLEEEEEEDHVRVKRPDTQEGFPKGPGEATSGLAVTVGGASHHKNSPLS